MSIKKKEPLKPRGFRCTDPQWNKVRRKAKKSKGAKPSDVIRDLIDNMKE